ncbi:hypothetical protein [Zoogloea dura]|uniref:Uncharacterized protein n=1 Tax=Zoogloea dura TaxID=2728840 RepID=A0A848FZN7_9RHOO|nr:hypothetical protein [Zoogloea dura]NML24306.1 hypothetical protein [Zoogloea dura]
MNPRISLERRRFNERRRQPIHKIVAERIVLPCVITFAGGVLFALHFTPAPPIDLSCQDTAAKIAEHRTVVAQGGQQ